MLLLKNLCKELEKAIMLYFGRNIQGATLMYSVKEILATIEYYKKYKEDIEVSGILVAPRRGRQHWWITDEFDLASKSESVIMIENPNQSSLMLGLAISNVAQLHADPDDPYFEYGYIDN
jgi:hypothetical protein